MAPRKSAAQRAKEEEAKASVFSPRLTVEQLSMISRDVANYLAPARDKLESAATSPSAFGEAASKKPASQGYKPRLDAIATALWEHKIALESFQSYLNPTPTEALTGQSAPPASMEDLISCIEALLVRNSHELRAITSLF